MRINTLHVSGLIGATALAAVVAAAPAQATGESPYGARNHATHSRIYRHHHTYYRHYPGGVVGGAGVLADETVGGAFAAWDAMDCVTFGYYCRR